MANEFPELCQHTDNISLLHELQKIGKLSQADAGSLTTAYKKYRQRLHRLALQDISGLVDKNKYSSQKEAVISVWASMIGSN